MNDINKEYETAEPEWTADTYNDRSSDYYPFEQISNEKKKLARCSFVSIRTTEMMAIKIGVPIQV